MKKIDKSICLASEYLNWQQSTNAKYYSSHKYYKDVLCSLIICQNGLCAYTEYRLISENELEKIKALFDSSGRYRKARPDIPMDNEHFDSIKKNVNGWNWDNFFGVFSPINRDVKRVRESELIKNGKNIHSFFKPDNPNYNPKIYLNYDIKNHMFYPNPNLDSVTFKETKEMIYILGLNWGFIRMKRKEYISEYLKRKEYFNNERINQFYTAIELLEM